MNSRITTLGLGLTALLTLSTASSSEALFPPQHLAANAPFSAVTATQQHTAHVPWYEVSSRDSRQTLIANEVQEVAPYPAAYYIALIRAHANDVSKVLQCFHDSKLSPPQLVDKNTHGDSSS